MKKITLIDTHAHYNSIVMENLEEQIKVANNNLDVSKIINVGLDNRTSEEAVQISLNNSKFFSTLGIHPIYDENISKLEEIYFKNDNAKIVAVGETGIDTSKDISPQIDKFLDTIALANKLRLPLIIHSNTTKGSNTNANKICIEIIKKYPPLVWLCLSLFST